MVHLPENQQSITIKNELVTDLTTCNLSWKLLLIKHNDKLLYYAVDELHSVTLKLVIMSR